MKRKVLRYAAVLLVLVSLAFVSSCGGEKIIRKRKGNTETVLVRKGGADVFKLVYTYEKGRIVSGEYWEAADPKDNKKAKPAGNIYSNSSIMKSFDTALASKKMLDESNIKLDEVRDGFILKYVKKVKYNSLGHPVMVYERGYADYPVLGRFLLKVDTSYKYSRGRLIWISEKNMNVDSMLLNMGIMNVTTIQRDFLGRPLAVRKLIGSVPTPVYEKTTYKYYAGTRYLLRTVYKKAGISLTSLKVVPEKTITFYYALGIPWEGKKKYDFLASFDGIQIYNEIEKKDEIDLKNFKKMGTIEKAKVMAKVYDLIKNEMKGPRWRLGDLPDIPEPFLEYKDFKWWR